ncbi:MAG: type II toxin-antitoxin system PemK/MazF family toxin [Mycobacteriales bacterium]
MRRGDVYTAAVRGPYTGKARPVVVLQDDRFDATASITVCPLTTTMVAAPLARVPIEATDTNGLSEASRLMVDKVTTMPQDNLRTRLGRLSDEDMAHLSRAVIVFLGLV